MVNYTTHTNTLNANRAYGKQQECLIIEQLKNLIPCDDIKQSKERYSKYDALGMKSKILYEIKALQYGRKKYPTCVFNCDKQIVGVNQVFVFQFEETGRKDLYYICFDKNKFNTYNQRDIPCNSRNTINWCWDIPFEDLTLIDFNKTYDMKNEMLTDYGVNSIFTAECIIQGLE